MNNRTPITLIIMDGYGINPSDKGNAVAAARTPNLDSYFKDCPNTLLGASGLDVGLPDGQMGNSEVGHTNIGAGRIVYQELTRITKSINDGDFYENTVLSAAMDNCLKHNSNLHIMGLMSDGGVHSHDTHVWALLQMAKKKGLEGRVLVHCFLDGRDTPPSSGRDYVAKCVEKCNETGALVATVMGRYYAMDRDNRWERVTRAYDAIVYSKGTFNPDPVGAVEASYAKGVTDEFVEPVVCVEDKGLDTRDSVIFYNFRPDRAREITRCFVDPEFSGFERKTGCINPFYVCMTQYDAKMPNVKVAYKPQSLSNTLGEYLSSLGLKQLRIAETEKYAHVTFFFNGGTEAACKGENRVMIPSPKVATYDMQPEMSALEVTDAVVDCIHKGGYDVIILNYANCDMVGHTGIIEAAVKAVETVDTCVKRVVDAMKERGGITLITSDHGNADRMLDDDGTTPFTAHSTYPVPFIISGASVKLKKGVLADIAPTMLDLMGLDKPAEMDGKSLICCPSRDKE